MISTGRKEVSIRVSQLVMDILDQSTRMGEDRTSRRLDIEKEGRLKEAKRKKEKLLMYLDRWWTTLEGGGSQI